MATKTWNGSSDPLSTAADWSPSGTPAEGTLPSDSVRPVRIAAHAFADGLPHRDLLVSPEHALFVDGVLIPAHRLLNHSSVTQDAPAAAEYFHVELDRHEVLLAEGLPAESYLDTGNRTMFANAPLVALHPEPAASGSRR